MNKVLSEVRAVCFDAGQTLFTERTSRQEVYCAVARRHGIHLDVAACATVMANAHETLPQSIHGAFRYTPAWFHRYIDHVFTALGQASVSDSLRRDLFQAFEDPGTFRVFDDVVPTLSELRARRFRLAVISNWAPSLPQLLTGLQLRSWFDGVVVSATERLEKPDARCFEKALLLLGTRAKETLHVGDRVDLDVLPARNAGLCSLLLDRNVAPDVDRIQSLGELPALLPDMP